MIAGDNGGDYMTICQHGWNRFAGSSAIPVEQEKSISELEAVHLDDIGKYPPDSVFVHELTHADDFWDNLAIGELADECRSEKTRGTLLKLEPLPHRRYSIS
jgi:hypothetical protein